MSLHIGKLVWVAPHATLDSFVGKTVINVLLRDTETDELIKCYVIPSNGFVPPEMSSHWNAGSAYLALDREAQTTKFRVYSKDPLFPVNPNEEYTLDHVRIRAAIGDVVSISWSYESCNAKIVAFADERKELMRWKYEERGDYFATADEFKAYFERGSQFEDDGDS